MQTVLKFGRYAWFAFLVVPPLIMTATIVGAVVAIVPTMSYKELGWWSIPVWAWCLGFVFWLISEARSKETRMDSILWWVRDGLILILPPLRTSEQEANRLHTRDHLRMFAYVPVSPLVVVG